MPLIEAGFADADGHADRDRLILFGPTVSVTVGHIAPLSEPQNKRETVAALIDTGASESCIDEALATKLGLQVIDRRTISGVGGAQARNVYLAYIDIPQLDLYQYGSFTGVALTAGGQSQSVLLGRTFLQNTIMIYDGVRSQVTLASAKRVLPPIPAA